jgi:predicted MFS family arabinose efflux permease
VTDQPSISVPGGSVRQPPPVEDAVGAARVWQNLTVRLAVALAFADASIVVLALPQIVVRLHTSISQVVWVIMAYNLALIVTAAGVIPFARRLASAQALIGGLTLFGLASVGCGLANSMAVLVPFRCLQGVGGGLLLCASLPMFAGTARPGDSPLNGWSAAAAIGMAVGPALGGILTQLFDWRSIFLAQAPVAALAAVLVWAVHVHFEHELDDETDGRRSSLDPLTANAALLLLSAGLITALFLVVLVLIDVWALTPIGAAAVVTTIPVATAIAERAVRGRSPLALGAVGAALAAAGLLGLSFVTHRQLGWVILTLALVGTGLGLAYPGLTTAALRTGGPAAARAAKTVAARDAGIVLGLLVLTPVFVNQLNKAPNQALPAATRAVVTAPMPAALKFSLVPGLIADYKRAPQTQLPNFSPTFARASARATPAERVALGNLHDQLDSIVQRAATSAFKLPLRYGAIFAIVVLPLLGLGLILSRNGRRTAAVP